MRSMSLGNLNSAIDVLKKVGNVQFLMLKIEEENRDYDVYCSKSYAEDFHLMCCRESIDYICFDYIYVKRYFVFGDYNVAIDLIVEPRIRARIYNLSRVNYNLSDRFIATDEENDDWRLFQSNIKKSNAISSRITIASLYSYLKILYRLQFRVLGLTYSGPDGSGKSTSIAKVEHALNLMRIDFRRRRQVYGILPRPAKLLKKQIDIESENKDPNGGKQKGLVASLIVSVYYLLDYFLGKLFWLFRRNRYEIIVFDRYVMDFLVNIERNALHPSMSWLFRICMPLLQKGFNHHFCYAPADIILSRKAELDLSTIIRLNKEYLNLRISWFVWKCW